MDIWFSRNNGSIECTLHLRWPVVDFCILANRMGLFTLFILLLLFLYNLHGGKFMYFNSKLHRPWLDATKCGVWSGLHCLPRCLNLQAIGGFKQHVMRRRKTKPTKSPVRPAKTQISLGNCTVCSVFTVSSKDSQGSESSLGTQVILLVLSCCGKNAHSLITSDWDSKMVIIHQGTIYCIHAISCGLKSVR